MRICTSSLEQLVSLNAGQHKLSVPSYAAPDETQSCTMAGAANEYELTPIILFSCDGLWTCYLDYLLRES